MSKHGKRLNRCQRNQLSKLNYNPDQYRMLYDLHDHFVLSDKKSNQTVVVNKNMGGEK